MEGAAVIPALSVLASADSGWSRGPSAISWSSSTTLRTDYAMLSLAGSLMTSVQALSMTGPSASRKALVGTWDRLWWMFWEGCPPSTS